MKSCNVCTPQHVFGKKKPRTGAYQGSCKFLFEPFWEKRGWRWIQPPAALRGWCAPPAPHPEPSEWASLPTGAGPTCAVDDARARRQRRPPAGGALAASAWSYSPRPAAAATPSPSRPTPSLAAAAAAGGSSAWSCPLLHTSLNRRASWCTSRRRTRRRVSRPLRSWCRCRWGHCA